MRSPVLRPRRWSLPQVYSLLCPHHAELQPLRGMSEQQSWYASSERLNRSIEMGAPFQPCLCLPGAWSTISLLLMCLSHPSLIDIQQCVRIMVWESHLLRLRLFRMFGGHFSVISFFQHFFFLVSSIMFNHFNKDFFVCFSGDFFVLM